MRRSAIALWLTLGLPALHLAAGGCGGGPPPALSHFEGVARSADGLAVSYVTDGAGDPALVFVHCWSCDRSYWENQIAPFRDDHRIVRIDLGGHGESGTGREEWTMQSFAADVNAVLDELNLEDVILVGHSMGGAVIAEAALASPERVRGLVGVDNFQRTSLGISEEQIQGYVAWFESDFAANVEGWVLTMFPAGSDSVLAKRIAGDMAAGSPEVGVGAMGHLLRWYDDSAAGALAELPAPLLAINGDANPTDVDALKEIRPDYELRLMQGVGHFLALEDPETFNGLLAECIASFPPRTGRK